MPIKNLSGQSFTDLFVIKDTGKRTYKREVIWLCLCTCGNFSEVPGSHLLEGHNKSCGHKKRLGVCIKGHNIDYSGIRGRCKICRSSDEYRYSQMKYNIRRRMRKQEERIAQLDKRIAELNEVINAEENRH